MRRPTSIATKRYFCGCIAVIVIFSIDIAWLRYGGYRVEAHGIRATIETLLVLAAVAAGFAGMVRIPRYRQATRKLRYLEVSRTAMWMGLLLLFAQTTAILSYLCVATDMPLIDADLVYFDHRLGFEWPAYSDWIDSMPLVKRVFAFSYASGMWQLVLVPIALGMLGRNEELSEFVLHVMLSSVPVLLISTCLPAASAFLHFHVSSLGATATVSDFFALRHGALHRFDLAHIQGLVSFPSFHAVMAVIFAYAFRRMRLLFPFAFVLNALMLASTLSEGGHYLVDVLGGLTVVSLTIFGLNLASREHGANLPVAAQTYGTS